MFWGLVAHPQLRKLTSKIDHCSFPSQGASTACLGFAAFQSQACLSFSTLIWIKTQWLANCEFPNLKIPFTLEACTFFSKAFPVFCLLISAFPSKCFICWFIHLTLWKFQCIALQQGVLSYSEMGDLPKLRQALFSYYAIFKWHRTYKTCDLTDCRLQFAMFYLHLPWERMDKAQGEHNFSSSYNFLLCLFLFVTIALFLKSPHGFSVRESTLSNHSRCFLPFVFKCFAVLAGNGSIVTP